MFIQTCTQVEFLTRRDKYRNGILTSRYARILNQGIMRRIQHPDSHPTQKLNAFPIGLVPKLPPHDVATWLLLRKIPRLLVAIWFSRNLHWDRDDSLKHCLTTLPIARHTTTHWHNHPTFPIPTVEFGLFCCPILKELAPGALRAVG